MSEQDTSTTAAAEPLLAEQAVLVIPVRRPKLIRTDTNRVTIATVDFDLVLDGSPDDLDQLLAELAAGMDREVV